MLQPNEAWHACLLYTLEDGEQHFRAPRDCIGQCGKSQHAGTMAQWLKIVAKIESSDEEFYRLFNQALEDMASGSREPPGRRGQRCEPQRRGPVGTMRVAAMRLVDTA